MWQPGWHRNLENGYMYTYGWVTSLFTWNNHNLVCLLIGYVKLKVLVTQSCPTLCDSVDCSPPGSSACGILQARILEWVAISFSRGSSQLKDRTQVSCIAGRFFTVWVTRKGHILVFITKVLLHLCLMQICNFTFVNYVNIIGLSPPLNFKLSEGKTHVCFCHTELPALGTVSGIQ